MWYVAHVMIYTRFKDGNQNKYPVCENMYLVQASTEEEAYAKATALGQEEEGDADGTYHYEDRAAELVFAGIRKVVTCANREQRPVDGAELSYSMLEVTTADELKALSTGESVVRVAYVD